MNRLALSVLAVVTLLGTTAFAEKKTEYWNTSRDLSTFEPTGEKADTLSLQPKAQEVTYTLSRDTDLSEYVELEMAPYNNGNLKTPGSIVLDLAPDGVDHTLKLYGYHSRPPDAVSTNVLVKGGKIDFSSTGLVYLVGWNGNFYDGNSIHAVFDGTEIANPLKLFIHDGLSNSRAVFRNGAEVNVPSASGGYVYFVDHAFASEGGLQTRNGEVRFESGSRFVSDLASINLDNRRNGSAEAIRTTRTEVPVVFTGRGSYLDTKTLAVGVTVRGQKLVFSDYAGGVCGGSGLLLGYPSSSNGYGQEAELVVTDHAAFTNRAGLTIGTLAGCDNCRVTVSDGAELVCSSKDDGTSDKYVYVGYRSNGNELLVSNATFNASRLFFGYTESAMASVTGNVAKFVGPQTVIKYPLCLQQPFASSGNTLIFDGVSLQVNGYFYGYIGSTGAWQGNLQPSNNTVRIENGAKLQFTSILAGKRGSTNDTPYPANGLTFVLGNDAELTLTSQFLQSGKDGLLVVSNGLMTITSANGFDMAAVTAVTTHEVTGNRAVFRGAHPRIVCTAAGGHIDFQGTAVSVDVSEAPVDGYVKPVLEADEVWFQKGKLSLKGVDIFRRRMAAAGQTHVDLVLAKTVSRLEVYDTDVAAINKELEDIAPGFRLVENPAGHVGELVLQCNCAVQAKAVPSGTAGNSPTAPYDTWETAANSIAEALRVAGPDGEVSILSGTYADEKGVNQPVPALMYAAPVKVYADTTMSAAGELTIIQRVFGGGPVETDDPNRNAFVFSYGTCHCQALSSGCFFTDHVSPSGKRANYKVTFTGPDTSFDFIDDGTNPLKNFYIGYQSSGVTMTVADGARGSILGCSIGAYATSTDSTLIVSDGAELENGGTVYVSNLSGGNRVIVSNATLRAGAISVKKAAAGNDPNALIAGGENPSVALTGSLDVEETSVLRIDVSEAPITGFAQPPVSANRVLLRSGSVLHVEGCAKLLERLAAANDARVTLTLAKSLSATDDIDAAVLDAAIAELPTENCKLYKSAGSLKLSIGKPKGLLLIVQ